MTRDWFRCDDNNPPNKIGEPYLLPDVLYGGKDGRTPLVVAYTRRRTAGGGAAAAAGGGVYSS